MVGAVAMLVGIVVGFYLGRLSQGQTSDETITTIIPKIPKKGWASPLVISTDEVEIEVAQKREEAEREKERIDLKDFVEDNKKN